MTQASDTAAAIVQSDTIQDVVWLSQTITHSTTWTEGIETPNTVLINGAFGRIILKVPVAIGFTSFIAAGTTFSLHKYVDGATSLGFQYDGTKSAQFLHGIIKAGVQILFKK